MIRKAILTLGMLAVASAGYAQSKQPCATDDVYREQKALFPGIIEAQEAQLKADIDQYMLGRTTNAHAKTTHHDGTPSWPDDTKQYHIPVVVHIISDYGAGVPFITDADIDGMISRLNGYYSATNPGIPNSIIAPFKPYIGNAHISFHLATKDPFGKPTRGITRHFSQHAAGGDELAKIGTWAPDRYLNIYLENLIGRKPKNGLTLAYATFPTSYDLNPYSQGVIARADQALANPPTGDVTTLAHEVGHFLFLYHTWNSNSADVEEGPCGDDEVDDTPPTFGHFSCSTSKLYDTVCGTGYMKFYDAQTAYHMFKDSSAASKQKNYPDTTNTQNIMDYSACPTQMFTRGQVARMRGALRSAVGFRSNLVDTANLITTGIMDASFNFLPIPDVAPVAEFSVNRPFICADPNSTTTITSRSHNTPDNVAWTFSNGASVGNSANAIVNNSFSQPGWVTISLRAISDVNGVTVEDTLTRSDMLYAADPVSKDPTGYYQDFNHSSYEDSLELSKYPIFNFFGTSHRWEVVDNAGYYDKTSIRYANYETRFPNINNASESPRGDYADFYTPAFNLSGFGSTCNLSFFSAGAFRTTKPSEMNDKLEISVSTDCGQTWDLVDTLKGGRIGNNGYRNENFTPTWMGEWMEQSIPLTGKRGSQTFFRFRFKAGVVNPGQAISGNVPYYGFGSGNNFYLDRIRIVNTPLGVKNGVIMQLGMSVAPNPTNGAATVSLNGGDNSVADLSVTDVTGKLVYSSSVVRTTATTKVEIPASAISVKGMYLVKVVTNGATETQKLIVY
jgi:hypothetical protein